MTSHSSKNQNTPGTEQNSRNQKIRVVCNSIAGTYRFIGGLVICIIRFLKSIDTLIVATATVFLAWIAYWQWNALEKTDRTLRETLVGANRAWISPTALTVNGKIEGDADIPIQIHYTNVGKGPALQMNAGFYVKTVPIPGNMADYEPLSGGNNTTCRNTLLIDDSYAIFPNPEAHLSRESVIERKLITPAVHSNNAAILVQGCFVYETMSETHRSWFCFVAFRKGQFASLNLTVMCKDGHGAD